MLWFATSGGVTRFDGETFTSLTTSDDLIGKAVRCIYQDSEGILWFGTRGGGLSSYDGQTITTFMTEDGLPNDWIGDITGNGEQGLWLLTGGTHFSSFDGTHFVHQTSLDGFLGNGNYDLFVSAENTLWIGGWHFLTRFDGQSFVYFTKPGSDSSVQTMTMDADGGLWCGTRGLGIMRYDASSFATFTTQDGLFGNVVSGLGYGMPGSASMMVSNSLTSPSRMDCPVTTLAVCIVAQMVRSGWVATVAWFATMVSNLCQSPPARGRGGVRLL